MCSDCWMLIPIYRQIVPSQAFSDKKHQFFAEQSLQSLRGPPTKGDFKMQPLWMLRVTKPYTKCSYIPGQLEIATEPLLNTYKNKDPYIGTITSVKRIVGSNALGETCHIVVHHDGNVPYWEGQSYGIIPPVSISALYCKGRLRVLSTS